ncbi:MAG: MBL fold metallo-hydrolase [Planctomycetota bacterium]
MSIKVRVFGSTSAGNATIVWDGTHALMVDCGLGVRYTDRCLREIGLGFDRTSGVFITHAHSDHASPTTLKRLVRGGARLYAHPGVMRALVFANLAAREAVRLGLYQPWGDGVFTLGRFTVRGFAVSHDAEGGCWGYTITATPADAGAARRITVATDVGCTDDALVGHFADADVIVIESNHDTAMLAASSRPGHLKARIRGDQGHLSNDQCAAFLARVLRGSSRMPAAVMLAHISQECNTPELAAAAIRAALAAHAGAGSITVHITHRETPSAIVALD